MIYIILNLLLKVISTSLQYPDGIVKHTDRDVNAGDVLRMVDLVIYGSFLEEKSFPDILIKAMCYGKLIVAPNLSMIRRYVCHLSSVCLLICTYMFVVEMISF